MPPEEQPKHAHDSEKTATPRSVIREATLESRRLTQAENEQVRTYSKLVTTVCLLLYVAAFLIYNPAILVQPRFVIGAGIVVFSSFLTLFIYWRRMPASLAVLIDLLSICGIVLAAASATGMGISLLITFPVISIVWTIRAPGVIIGPAVATILIWVLVGGPPRVATMSILIVAPIYFFVLAVLTYLLSVKSAAHGRMIQKQARFIAKSAVAAEKQESAITDLFDAIDVGAIAVNGTGNILIENKAMFRLMAVIGIEPEDFPNVRNVYREDGKTLLEGDDHPARAFARREDWANTHVWVVTDDGTRLALALTFRHLYTPEGEHYLSAAFIEDITPRVEAERVQRELLNAASADLAAPLKKLRDLTVSELDTGAVDQRRLAIASEFTAKAGDFLQLVSDFATAPTPGEQAPVTDVTASVLRAFERRGQTLRMRGLVLSEQLGTPIFARLSGAAVAAITRYAADLAIDIAAPGSTISLTSPGEFGPLSFAIEISQIARRDWVGISSSQEVFELGELRRVVRSAGCELVAENRAAGAHISIGFAATQEQL